MFYCVFQLYLYEYDEETSLPKESPRQICPTVVVTFKKKSSCMMHEPDYMKHVKAMVISSSSRSAIGGSKASQNNTEAGASTSIAGGSRKSSDTQYMPKSILKKPSSSTRSDSESSIRSSTELDSVPSPDLCRRSSKESKDGDGMNSAKAGSKSKQNSSKSNKHANLSQASASVGEALGGSSSDAWTTVSEPAKISTASGDTETPCTKTEGIADDDDSADVTEENVPEVIPEVIEFSNDVEVDEEQEKEPKLPVSTSDTNMGDENNTDKQEDINSREISSNEDRGVQGKKRESRKRSLDSEESQLGDVSKSQRVDESGRGTPKEGARSDERREEARVRGPSRRSSRDSQKEGESATSMKGARQRSKEVKTDIIPGTSMISASLLR